MKSRDTGCHTHSFLAGVVATMPGASVKREGLMPPTGEQSLIYLKETATKNPYIGNFLFPIGLPIGDPEYPLDQKGIRRMKQTSMERLISIATAAVVVVGMAIAASGHAQAEEGATPSPRDGQGQGMAPMQQQMMQGMMQQMQNCMGQMGAMGGDVSQDQMRAQMMQRMQSCTTQMQSGKGQAPKDSSSDQKGAPGDRR
ncbi:MAG: hypothetical protein AB1781_01095 [Pseudomonadota bacterium]